MNKSVLTTFLLLTACGPYVEDRLSENFEPIYLAPEDNEQVESRTMRNLQTEPKWLVCNGK